MWLSTIHVTVLSMLLLSSVLAAEEVKKMEIKLKSEPSVPGVVLPGSKMVISEFTIEAKVDSRGNGVGIITLNPNVAELDEWGNATTQESLKLIKRECSLKFVKRERFGPRPGDFVNWSLFKLSGPNISTSFFLITEEPEYEFRSDEEKREAEEAKQAYSPYSGRILVAGQDGKIKYSIDVQEPYENIEPCHPGCFPADTLVLTPAGIKRIDSIQRDNLVTLIDPEGKSSSAKVQSVFVTQNRLLEIDTEDGPLITTNTQPMRMPDGGYRPAGELKPGDVILRWHENKTKPVAIRAITNEKGSSKVYNLVVGDLAVFVANGFLVRTKPPALKTEEDGVMSKLKN